MFGDRNLIEPEGPWFVNVIHMVSADRPLCLNPVDYGLVSWSEDWTVVDCAACHRRLDRWSDLERTG